MKIPTVNPKRGLRAISSKRLVAACIALSVAAAMALTAGCAAKPEPAPEPEPEPTPEPSIVVEETDPVIAPAERLAYSLDADKSFHGIGYTVDSSWPEVETSSKMQYTLQSGHELCVCSYEGGGTIAANDYYASLRQVYEDDPSREDVVWIDGEQSTMTVNDWPLTIFEYSVSYTDAKTGEKKIERAKAAWGPRDDGYYAWAYEKYFNRDGDFRVFDDFVFTLQPMVAGPVS